MRKRNEEYLRNDMESILLTLRRILLKKMPTKIPKSKGDKKTMKAYRKKDIKPRLEKPIILEIETQKELDFLYGLLNMAPSGKKENCNDFDNTLNDNFFHELHVIKNDC